MNDRNLHHRKSTRKTAWLWPQLLIGAIGIVMVLARLPAQASESQTPWECSSYTSDAHTRCVEAFVELQRDQIAALQGKLQAQQETVNLLKDQLDRQAATSAKLQRQLAQPPAVAQALPPLYAYPSVGLGLYFGRPWAYGLPYYYRPYVYGPRYWDHRW
jgi:septal ring factor EnvC (AmiA/AmiB activator)